jgi:hypothetical protein
MAQEQKARNILIAVPTTGGNIKAKTAESLIKLVKILTRRGIDTDIYNINNSDVIAARNRYGNMVLESDKWDSLLFIDSDMQFLPRAVIRMIEFNAPVTAVACTTRELNLEKFGAAMREHGDIERAKAESSRFNVLDRWGAKSRLVVRKRAGFVTAAAVGMAVCLIKKSALQAMVDEGAVEERVDRYGGGLETRSWGFFDLVKAKNVIFSEDFSFCHRWTRTMSRLLWVCTDEDIGHLGDFAFSGRYATVLEKQLVKAKPAAAALASENGQELV